MHRKIANLILLALAFGVGLLTADYEALAAGRAPAGSSVTLIIVVLLAIGVYGWYRIVKTTAEQNAWRNREYRLGHRTAASR